MPLHSLNNFEREKYQNKPKLNFDSRNNLPKINNVISLDEFKSIGAY